MRFIRQSRQRRRRSVGVLLCTAMGVAWPLWVPAQSDVYVYPAGCFDAHGRPFDADPSNPTMSANPACQPPRTGAAIRGSRSGTTPAAGAPTLQSGSINLPPTPVPVPRGIGVMNP